MHVADVACAEPKSAPKPTRNPPDSTSLHLCVLVCTSGDKCMLVYQKIKILSSFSHPYVILNLYKIPLKGNQSVQKIRLKNSTTMGEKGTNPVNGLNEARKCLTNNGLKQRSIC